MLSIKLKNRVPKSEIRKKTQVIDIVEYIHSHKWKWEGHIARGKDNSWTKRCTGWQPRSGRRDRGRPETRWMDEIRKVQNGRGRYKIGENGRHILMATSSSGCTKPPSNQVIK
ncbi:endonuclease-reverse transcriptase [Plakobranchus ocellatus]|uniref:Endonuclease-reverse transcriptase n=1 Tax=Plakobranchus ocellatus TaxID=259542 RepID=A0AAV4E2E4_9GAST|nr:endonuclease-reverse transcriptase [Plakobranchus ocellatus]